MTDHHNIVLAGFMGTGKSTVGLLLSKRLGWPLVDTDEEIERVAGCSIPEIFAADGEEAFRRLEKRVVREVAERGRQVVSTGGGVVKDPDNLAVLEETGTVFCLRAAPETILERVQHETHRPLLEGGDKLQTIREILASREEMYGQVHNQVDTDGLIPQQVVEKILSLVEEA